MWYFKPDQPSKPVEIDEPFWGAPCPTARGASPVPPKADPGAGKIPRQQDGEKPDHRVHKVSWRTGEESIQCFLQVL